MREITKFQLQKFYSLSFGGLVILLGDFHGQSHGSGTKVNFQLELVASSSSSRSRCRWKKRSVCVACELEQHRKCVRGCSRWCVAALFKSERNSCETTMAMNIFVHFISLHCPIFYFSLSLDFELELADISILNWVMILRRDRKHFGDLLVRRI